MFVCFLFISTLKSTTTTTTSPPTSLPALGAQAPRCPSSPLRDVGPLSGGQRERSKDDRVGQTTTTWRCQRRHETPSHDTVSPTTTRRAPGYGGPDDDAKRPRSRWARRRREDPNNMVSPTTTRRAPGHGGPDDDANSPRTR